MEGKPVADGEILMADIEIYTTRYCPFCVRAKQLLSSKGLDFDEVAVDGDAAKREEMTRRAGRHTVPQIWIKGEHIGGCDELMTLDRSGELDRRLA